MDENKKDYFEIKSFEDTVIWLRQNGGIKEESIERVADSLINGRKEARAFYESHLPEERISEIKSRIGSVGADFTGINEVDYLRELMKAYSESSALNNETTKKINGEII